MRYLISVMAIWLAACSSESGGGSGGPGGPPPVTVASPERRSITDWDEYTGRLEAVESVEVRARVSGYLESVHFSDGQIVEAEQLLFVIDPRPYQTAVDRARAEVNQAQVRLKLAASDLERARNLFQSRAISEEEFDARTQDRQISEAALQAARASLAQAELELSFTEIRAPIAGRVGRKQVTVGNLVGGGSVSSTLLTTIVSLDPIHVYFTADERSYLKYVRLDERGERPSSRGTANPVRMKIADEEGFVHEGVMDFVDNEIDEATGTMQGRAVFDNPDGTLIPGLFARVQLLGRGPYDALLVPDAAIGTDQAVKFVYVVGEDNVVARRTIELGPLEEDGMRIVRSGLAGSERVVVKGLQRVRVGNPVTPGTGEGGGQGSSAGRGTAP